MVENFRGLFDTIVITLVLFGQANTPIVQKVNIPNFINLILFVCLRRFSFIIQKNKVRTSFLRSTRVRHYGDFIVQKFNIPIYKFNPFVRLLSLTFQKSIVKTSFVN